MDGKNITLKIIHIIGILFFFCLYVNVAPGPEKSWTVFHAEMLPEQSEEHRVNYHHGYCFKYLPRMLEEFQAKVEDINDGQRQG